MKQSPTKERGKKTSEESTEGTEIEDIEERSEESKSRPMNVIVRFNEEEEEKNIDPFMSTKALKAQVVEIKHAKIFRDGNLLIGCHVEVQVGKADKLG